MLAKRIGAVALGLLISGPALADQGKGLSEEFCIELGWQLVSTLDFSWNNRENPAEYLEGMAHAYSLIEPYKDDELKMAQAMLCLWGASRN